MMEQCAATINGHRGQFDKKWLLYIPFLRGDQYYGKSVKLRNSNPITEITDCIKKLRKNRALKQKKIASKSVYWIKSYK